MGKVFIWQESERIDESGESKERARVAGLVDKCFDLAIYGVQKCGAARKETTTQQPLSLFLSSRQKTKSTNAALFIPRVHRKSVLISVL